MTNQNNIILKSFLLVISILLLTASVLSCDGHSTPSDLSAEQRQQYESVENYYADHNVPLEDVIGQLQITNSPNSVEILQAYITNKIDLLPTYQQQALRDSLQEQAATNTKLAVLVDHIDENSKVVGSTGVTLDTPATTPLPPPAGTVDVDGVTVNPSGTYLYEVIPGWSTMNIQERESVARDLGFPEDQIANLGDAGANTQLLNLALQKASEQQSSTPQEGSVVIDTTEEPLLVDPNTIADIEEFEQQLNAQNEPEELGSVDDWSFVVGGPHETLVCVNVQGCGDYSVGESVNAITASINHEEFYTTVYTQHQNYQNFGALIDYNYKTVDGVTVIECESKCPEYFSTCGGNTCTQKQLANAIGANNAEYVFSTRERLRVGTAHYATFLAQSTQLLEGYEGINAMFGKPDDDFIYDELDLWMQEALGGIDGWSAGMCRRMRDFEPSVSDGYVIGENIGTSAHVSAQKTPIVNVNGTNSFVYKLGWAVHLGDCEEFKINVELTPNTKKLYTSAKTVTGSINEFFVIESVNDYTKICINFKDVPNGCFAGKDDDFKTCNEVVLVDDSFSGQAISDAVNTGTTTTDSGTTTDSEGATIDLDI
ncbi:hypothetical protein GOV04_00615 [Candidatus Woesearchaeota archaeon]|nr:hypothetical protein [Candidatus Woesearchaeota archaeon]